MGEIARLHLRQLLGGRRVWLLAGFVTLPVLLTLSIRIVAGLPVGDFTDALHPAAVYLFLLYPQAVCMLLALLDGALALSIELEGRTLTYLFTRPVPKWKIVMAKYIAGTAATTPLVVGSLLLSMVIVEFPGGVRWTAALFACTVASLAAYNAIYALIGALVPRRAMVLCMLYSGIVEFALSFAPLTINHATASYFLRSLAFAISGLPLPPEAGPFLGGTEILPAVFGLIAVTGTALAAAMIVVTRREFVMIEPV